MNAVESPAQSGQNIIQDQLRAALADPRRKKALLAETGWDESMPSKVLAGGAGITIEKLDLVCHALGLTVVAIQYMDYLSLGNSIGANCCRARMSQGHCTGPR